MRESESPDDWSRLLDFFFNSLGFLARTPLPVSNENPFFLHWIDLVWGFNVKVFGGKNSLASETAGVRNYSKQNGYQTWYEMTCFDPLLSQSKS